MVKDIHTIKMNLALSQFENQDGRIFLILDIES
jgi:hypothetical protein